MDQKNVNYQRLDNLKKYNLLSRAIKLQTKNFTWLYDCILLFFCFIFESEIQLLKRNCEKKYAYIYIKKILRIKN